MPRRTKPLRPRRRAPHQTDLFEGPQASGIPSWSGLPTQTQAALIELMARMILDRAHKSRLGSTTEAGRDL
jgi:hypothetical protein